MFKVGDRVRTRVSSTKVEPGDLGIVSGFLGSTRVKVRFDTYNYAIDTHYHGIEGFNLELVQPAKPKGISAFIKRVEKEYSNVKTA